MTRQKASHKLSCRQFSGAIEAIGTFFLFLFLATACQGDINMMTATNPKTTVPENTSAPRPQHTPGGEQARKSATPAGVSPQAMPPSPLNEIFWTLNVGQTPDEVRTLLGEPEATGSEGIHVSYWDYSAEGSKAMLRIRFRENAVSAIHLYEGQYHVADLLEKFGPPPLVYEADLTEERMGIYSRVFLAYPEQGFYAYVDHLNPIPEDKLDLLYQLPAEDLAHAIEEAKSSTGIRIVTWP
ncbi:MAG: hypothetical protein ACOYYS_00295 [Chloroflexota bacterium]